MSDLSEWEKGYAVGWWQGATIGFCVSTILATLVILANHILRA